MKKSTSPSFIQRVFDLFRYEENEPTPSHPSNEEPAEEVRSKEWETDKHRSHRAYNPVDKSYESNLDRYKHPSDLHRGR